MKSFISDNTKCIVNLSKISQQFHRWNNNLSQVRPFYAVKCNQDVEILKYMNKIGLNSFDCASQNEIETVMNITNNPKNIIYANPAKKISSLQFCNDIYKEMMMTFDSVYELQKIKKYAPDSQLILRIKSDDSSSVCKFNTKFGVDYTNCSELFVEAEKLKLNVMGVSFHVGSGCSNPNAYRTTLEYCNHVTQEGKTRGFDFRLIDIGGGFVGSNNYLFEQVSKVIQDSIEEMKLQDKQFIGEPGRFMVETCQTLELSIINKKKQLIDREECMTYYVSDGLYGSLNNVIYDHAILDIDINSHKKKYRTIIFGPTCDSFDKLGEFWLPEKEIGEIFIINNAGAYTTAAGSEFNGMPRPDKIYIE